MGVISLDLQQTDAGYDVEKEIKRLDQEIDDEVAARVAADTSIWEEIETIEAASDVVDVVGTHAALEDYDTSKLQDNDIIKVLQDETRDDAITYYRWNEADSTFVYVGAEGPYYTASETDTLLAAKQDTLIAGDNITIAADGKTISATDTTYTHFTGATASTDGVQGLVPGPLAGDEDKYLKADGTWATVQSGGVTTIFYSDLSQGDQIFADQAKTTPATAQDILDAFEDGKVIIVDDNGIQDTITTAEVNSQNGSVSFVFSVRDAQVYYIVYAHLTDSHILEEVSRNFQEQLTAGANVQINNNVISATNTTYSDFTGATSSVAGAHGLVPAPTTSDVDKFLKGDGTWTAVQSGGTTTMFYSQDNVLYKDSARTVAATGAEVVAACGTGDVVIDMSQYDNSAMKKLHVVSYVDGGNWVAIVAVSYYRNMDGGPMTVDWHYTNANSTTAAYHRYTQLQKTLTAGSNITISGSTISARDTTYSAFGGATSQAAGSAGLVPAPAIGDDTKYLKGDGTWGTVQSGNMTITDYFIPTPLSSVSISSNVDIYTDESLTTRVSWSDFYNSVKTSQVRLIYSNVGGYYDAYYVYFAFDNTRNYSNAPEEPFYVARRESESITYTLNWDDSTAAAPELDSKYELQEKLTAGSNISISGTNVISATDTTYTAGTGIAISAQNVISASPNNISSNDWSGLWQ